MARRLYGASASDWSGSVATGPQPGQAYEVYLNDLTTRVTDLQTEAGVAATTATSDAAGYLRFRGPDPGLASYWVKISASLFMVVFAADLGDVVDGLASGLNAQVAAALTGQLGDITSQVATANTNATAAQAAAQGATDAIANLPTLYEGRIDRSGSATGQVVYRKADQSLGFTNQSGGGGGGSNIIGVVATDPNVPIVAGLYVNRPGVPVGADGTLGAVIVRLDIPMIGGAGSIVHTTWPAGATGTPATVGTSTVPALARRVVFSPASTFPLAQADLIRSKVTAVGSTFPGQGLEVIYTASATTTTVAAAPASVTGLTATGSVGQVALAWAASTGAGEYLVTRSGGAGFLILGVAETNSYVDTTGTAGTTYTYTVYAMNADAAAAGVTATGSSTAAATGTVFYTGAQIASTDSTHFTRTPQNGTLAASGSSGIFTTGATGASDNPRVQRTASTSESVGTNVARTKVTMDYRFPAATGGMYIKTRRNAADTQGTRILISYGGAGSGRIGQRAPGASGTTDYSSTTYPSSSVTLSHTTNVVYRVEVIDDPSLGTNGTIEVRVWDPTGTRPTAATFSVAPTTTELAIANLPAGQVCWDAQSFGTTARGFEVLSSSVTDMAI